jgi:hypothetical protein
MTAGKWHREPDPSRRHRLLADVDWTRRYTVAVIADARQAGPMCHRGHGLDRDLAVVGERLETWAEGEGK